MSVIFHFFSHEIPNSRTSAASFTSPTSWNGLSKVSIWMWLRFFCWLFLSLQFPPYFWLFLNQFRLNFETVSARFFYVHYFVTHLSDPVIIGAIPQVSVNHTPTARHLVAIVRKAGSGHLTSNQLRDLYRGLPNLDKLERKYGTGLFGTGLCAPADYWGAPIVRRQVIVPWHPRPHHPPVVSHRSAYVRFSFLNALP